MFFARQLSVQGILEIVNAISNKLGSILRHSQAENIRGLYVIIDPEVTGGRNPLEIAQGAVRGGASMLQLRDETLETILFGTLVDTKGVVLEQAPAHHGFKFTVDIGTQFGLHTAAPGKAMLAHMSKREQDRFIQAMSFEKYTKNTITNADDFRTELANAKIQG